jgi:pilus assembly protein CpaC
MRINFGFPWRLAVWAAALIVPGALAVATASAQPPVNPAGMPSRDFPGANDHQSFIRVDDTGGAPIRRNLKIGLGKSVLLEFPHDVRDVMVSNPSAVDAVVLSSNRVFLLKPTPSSLMPPAGRSRRWNSTSSARRRGSKAC